MPEPMPDPTIDRQVFRELQQAAGAEFVAELVDTFVEEAPPLLAELRQARAEGAAARFTRAAHSLKTNALTFGATALGEQARALELGGLAAATDGSLAALDEAWAQAAAALRELRELPDA